MLLNQFLLLAAVLFCIGVYGVIARRNAVMPSATSVNPSAIWSAPIFFRDRIREH